MLQQYIYIAHTMFFVFSQYNLYKHVAADEYMLQQYIYGEYIVAA